MNKVVTVNLNGIACSLEEPAYESLHAYLDDADSRLQANPDRSEIMSDLEQAIADKCRRHLGPHKNVVSAAEMEAILKDMGPVEADPAGAPGAARSEDRGAQARPDSLRRLYQIREGAMISGVCNGLAAYFNVDVTLVRIGFVAAVLLSGGLWILAYIIMMFVVPKADTAEERAAARGQPFNAQELVDRAKAHYAELREQGSRWQDDWRRRRRARREQRAAEAEREFWRGAQLQYRGYGTQVLAGLLVPVFTAASAALFVVLVLTVLSLLLTGGILDWTLPPDIPVWAAVLIVAVAYQGLHAPLRAASRASYEATAGPDHGWLAAADGLLWVGFAALLLWFAYALFPEVRDLLDDIRHGWRYYATA